jgi:apurinic endonuclease APN1
MVTIGHTLVTDNINQINSVLCEEGHGYKQGLQFSVNPINLKSSSQKLELVSKKQENMYLVLHGKYVYNFCRQNVENQIESLVQELQWATQLDCDVVIHQGKNIESEKMTQLEAISNYVRNLSDVIDRTFDSSACLLLENSAGQGTELGSTLDELSYIYHQFDDHIKERIGFCLDTCHIFVAGSLDVRKKIDVDEFFKRFDQQIGLHKLKCIHFNDSGIPFGGKRDLHGDILGGYISNPLLGGSSEGLQAVAKHAGIHQIPMIFETPYHLLNTIPQQVDFQYQLVESWANETILPDSDISHQIIQESFQLYDKKPKIKRKITLKVKS